MRIRAFNAPFCARIATLGRVWLARDVPVGCRVASHALSPLGRHRHAKACSRPRTPQTFCISLLLHLRIVWKLQYVYYSYHLLVPTQWYPLQIQGQTLRKSRSREVLALPLTYTHIYISRSLTSTLPGTYTISTKPLHNTLLRPMPYHHFAAPVLTHTSQVWPMPRNRPTLRIPLEEIHERQFPEM